MAIIIFNNQSSTSIISGSFTLSYKWILCILVKYNIINTIR